MTLLLSNPTCPENSILNSSHHYDVCETSLNYHDHKPDLLDVKPSQTFFHSIPPPHTNIPSDQFKGSAKYHNLRSTK